MNGLYNGWATISQAVYIDGSLSTFLEVDVGVQHGYILGPLCYVLINNDLPETIFDTHSHIHWSPNKITSKLSSDFP